MATATTTDRAFWDSSGLALLAIDQQASSQAVTLRRQTGVVIVWWATRVEVMSSIARLAREGTLVGPSLVRSRRKLEALADRWVEVSPSDSVRRRASDLVSAHPLRTADALQLAAALESARDQPRGRMFITFDTRLAQVARAVGFDVRP